MCYVKSKKIPDDKCLDIKIQQTKFFGVHQRKIKLNKSAEKIGF